MAVDKKISQLTSLAQVDVSASTDVLPIVDTSATETKKITVSALVGAGATAGISGAVLTNGTINSTTIGATTPSTGAFTTLSASSTVSGTGFSTYLASPPAIGSTAANTGAFTTLTTSSTVTLNGGTANGVLYLNGSKVATSGSALVFDGTNLGIGTASPSSPLTVQSNASALSINLIGRSAGQEEAWFRFYKNNGSTINCGILGSNQGLTFGMGSGLTEIARFDTSGNLGLGTTSPAAKLDVSAGNIRLSDNKGVEWGGANNFIYGSNSTNLVAIGTNNIERLRIDSSGNLGLGTTSPAGKFQVSATNNQVWAKDSATGDNLVTQVASGAARINAYTSANAALPIIFSHYITDVMTINASGNLGLGVTPSAWGGVLSKALEFNNGCYVTAFNTGSTDSIYMGANNYYNGTNYIYKSSRAASQYQQLNGAHYWWTAGSGTAGNAITFTQAMTLDASGNLLVGTTSLNRLGSSSTTPSFSVGNTGTTSSSDLYLYNAATASSSTVGVIAFGTTGTSASTKFSGLILSTLTATSTSTVTGDLQFYTTNAGSVGQRATITAAGELLVGVTSATANGGVIQVSNGITFPATQSASSNANTLDDYEEGTFDATLTPSTSGTITVNSSFNRMSYTKIGRQVTCVGSILISSVSSPVGGFVKLGGLPFTNSNLGEYSSRNQPVLQFVDSSLGTRTLIPCEMLESAAEFRIYKDASTFDANDELIVTFTYFV